MLTALTLSAHTGNAESADVLACTTQKLEALKSVTAENIESKLRQHFSIPALAIAAYGGGAKWKAHPSAQEEILSHFSDTKRLKRLFDGLEGFKNATLIKLVAGGNLRTGIVTVRSGKETLHATVTFSGTSCTIVYMCVAGVGCIHELFR